MRAAVALWLCVFACRSAVGASDICSPDVSAQGFAQPASAPREIDVLVEIPAGSFVKYELDPASGRMRVDRFQSMPVVYPANYGNVPASLAPDGDALDVLVYSREPIVPGALIRVRPVGVLRMTDGGDRDDKIIAVPVDDVDPTYSGIRDIGDLPTIERERVSAFFLTYKQLPAGRKRVELLGFQGLSEALEIVRESLKSAAGPAPEFPR